MTLIVGTLKAPPLIPMKMIKIYIFNYDHDSNFTSGCDDNSYPWGGPACSQYVGKIPTKDTTQDDFWKIISEKLQTEPARQILGAMSEEDGMRQMKLYIPLDDDSAIQNWVEAMSNQKLLLLLWIPYRRGTDADSPAPGGCNWLPRANRN